MYHNNLHGFLRYAVGAVLLGAAACGDRAGDRATADTSGSSFKVALLTPGPISDQSWNAGAYRGLERIRDSLGARISHIQTKTPAEFEENFRQYGSQGYQLVFGHGFEFQDAAQRVAPQYPKTAYVITSGATTGANIASLSFGFADASYLAGMVAGGMTKSGVVGCIGGTELPPVAESFAAFAAGAKAVRPNVKVLTSYIGNWDDVSAGKEQALAQIGSGADVIFQNADAAGLGVFQAAREHKDVFVVGSNSNQNDVAPETTLGSVVIDLPLAFLTVAKQVKSGTFHGGIIRLGTVSGVVTYVPNPVLAPKVPSALAARVDSIASLMKARRFTVPGAAPETMEETPTGAH